MSTKIYIVKGTSGSYSDRTDWNVCAVHDQEYARRLADRLNSLSAFKNEFNNRVYEEFTKVYGQAVRAPMPDGPHPGAEFRRLMCISSEYKTDEDRASFRRLQAEHMRAIEEWKAECKIIAEVNDKRFKDKEAERRAWIKENYIIPPELEEVQTYSKEPAGAYCSDSRYDFEELELL